MALPGGGTTMMGVINLPQDVVVCMLPHLNDVFAPMAETNSNSSDPMNAICAAQSGMTSDPLGMFNEFLTSYCKTKPSCQWAPPMVSVACSSTVLYHPTDIKNGLAKGAEKEAAFQKMCDETNIGWWTMRRGQLPVSFDCDKANKEASFARISFFAGGTGAAGEGDAFENDYVLGQEGWYMKEQELEREIESASGGTVRMMLFSAVTLRSQYLGILLVDGVLSVVSLILVWAYMWWTLESAFLASVAMFEIVFSVPVAMSLWTVVLQQKIEFYQMLTIYMILGIGADDAFILYDAWSQARFLDDEEVGDDEASRFTGRFAWAYRRSFKAMAITTATTCGSFVIGAASPLPQVQAFCVFAAVVVLVDWLFCVSLFASAIVLYEKYLAKSCGKKAGECCGPGCCCGLARCCSQMFCKSCVGELPPDDGTPVKRPLERFCEGPLFNFLNRARWFLIAFWIIVIVAMASVAGTMLRTAEKANPLGREGLDAIRGFEILLEEFSIFGVPTTSFAFGLDPEEPVAKWNTDGAEQVNYNAAEAAKVTSEAGQLELLGLCRAADLGKDAKDTRCEDRRCLVLGKSSAGRCAESASASKRSGVYVPDDLRCENGRYCFMEIFAKYWAHHIAGAKCVGQTAVSCPASDCTFDPVEAVCHSSKTEYDYPGLPADEFIGHLGSDGFATYMKNRQDTMNAMGREYDVLLETQLTGFRLTPDKSKLEFAWVSFNATFPTQNTVEQANRWYERWSEFQTDHGSNIGGFHTTNLYKFMVTQNEMVKAAVMGVLLSLVIAFVVILLATWNWWIALLGFVNIIGISVVFLGFVPIIGWSLGENECIFLIAVVGLSVDYSVHLLHAYHHGKDTDREGRCRHALAEMGISVINSSVTTLLAAAILFACGFYFFLQFGAFIFLVIGLSILMSISFLMPLLIVAGPPGDKGFLPNCRRQKAEA